MTSATLDRNTAEDLEDLEDLQSKTEQRVNLIVAALKGSKVPLSYEDLRKQTGSTRDYCLYILTTLSCIGLVIKSSHPTGTPGRPQVLWEWVG